MRITGRRTRVTLPVAAAVIVSTGLLGGPATGTEGQTDQDLQPVAEPAGDGWRIYQQSAPVDAVIDIVQGVRLRDGSCLISQSGERRPGDPPTVQDEIAFNLELCQSQFATYTITDAEQKALDAELSDGYESKSVGDSSLKTKSSDGAAALVVDQFEEAHSTTWYEDPPGKNVTSVRNDVNWWYNYNCVTGQNLSSATYKWYATTGWQLLSDDLNRGYNCGNAWSTSYAKFKNPVFCAYVDTYNTYDRNRINGQENGNYTWSYDVTKSGGCTGLLSVHHNDDYDT